MFNLPRIVLLWICIAIIVILACTTYAFASSAVPTRQGEGAGRISGYVVTHVRYHPASNPSKIDVVEFDLDGPATAVKIELIAADSVFHSCTHASENHWRCLVDPAVNISSMDELRVIATNE